MSVDSLPRSPLAWIPFFWQRVLFPGSSPPRTPPLRLALLLLLILPAVVLYPWFSFALFDPDEGRYAEIPREMLVRGDWIVPYLQGEPYLDKPPLFYWLVMVSFQIFGITDGAARLVPALAVHGTLLLTYLFGRRIIGERAALCGTLLLGLAPAFGGMGRLILLDGLLTFWVTLTVFSLFTAMRGPRLRLGWWVLAALACGCGVLTKGPVALLLTVPPLWCHRRLTGAPRLAGKGAMALFFGLVLAIALPWYLAVCWRLPQFARYFLWEHNVVRFLAPFDHLEPIWFYAPVLFLGLLPGTLLLVSFGRFLLNGQEAVAQQRSAELGFLLVAGGWCVLFFSLSGCKLATYILPAFPPLCLSLGIQATAMGWDRSHLARGIASCAFLVLCAGHHLLLPWFAEQRAPMGRPEIVRGICADPNVPIVCYPRHCDSVAFYLGRDDLQCYRSKHTHLLIERLREKPRTIVLCSHRHTLGGLRQALPPDLRIVHSVRLAVDEDLSPTIRKLLGETALGLAAIAIVERTVPGSGGATNGSAETSGLSSSP